MNNSDSNSRRKFLSDSIRAISFLGISSALSNSIVQAIASSAVAQTTTLASSPKRYVFLGLEGGPPRWLFDLPLTPLSFSGQEKTAGFVMGGFGTYVGVDSGKAVLRYDAWKDPKSNLWLPPVWASNPSTADGVYRNVVDHCLFIRGLDMEIDNHDLSMRRNQTPALGGISIGGRLAASSSMPFSAAVSGSTMNNSYRSDKQISPLILNHTVNGAENSISRAMSYFTGPSPIKDPIVGRVFDQFDQYAARQGILDHGLRTSKDLSDSLIVNGVSKFTSQWDGIFKKYTEAVARSLGDKTNTSKFMSAQDIPAPTTTDQKMRISSTDFATLTKLNNLVDEKSTVSNLAAVFTALEILLVNNLTQVCTFNVAGGIGNLLRADSGMRMGLGNDQHQSGAFIATIGTTFYYRAIIGCLDVLISALKAHDIFADTMIHIGSEFSRAPQTSGRGSEHGVRGSSALLISGFNESARVVGNIKNGTGLYKGTWGSSAPHGITGGILPLRVNDVATTVCDFLGVRNITTNGYSLLRLEQSKLETKNV